MKILIATHKSWNIDRALKLKKTEISHEIRIVSQRDELTTEMVEEYKPDYIFFPHWSFIIPPQIYERYNCVVFHMTDLPFGRGGSPLQNLIVRGYKTTKLSAIRVVKELDAGPVYLKEDLDLSGNAHEIYDRASSIIFEKMIPEILKGEIVPEEQEGEVVTFRRRTKEEGELKPDMPLETIYDYIRMLDAEGYPRAFMKFGDFTLEFSDGKYDGDSLEAKVVIHREKDNQ